MTLIVEGKAKDYEEGLTVDQLLALEHVEMPEYVTVSVNEELIDRETFSSSALKENDTVEFLYFMGGGK